jgi:hypothetical protein
MTSALIALQEAAVARLDESGLFSGVYHDAPARAQYPYVVLNCSDERDWSCKARQAREITLQLTLWDEQPSRLLTRESDVEVALMALSTGTNWCLSTLVLTGKRRSRNPGGPWSCTFEFRTRLVEQDNGAAT